MQYKCLPRLRQHQKPLIMQALHQGIYMPELLTLSVLPIMQLKQLLPANTPARNYMKNDREVGEIMVAKFPIVADMPPDPEIIMIKIEPEVIYYLDYSVEFGHREQIIL